MIPLWWKLAGAAIAIAVTAGIYSVHVSNLKEQAREEGRREAVNAIAAQDEKFVGALRAAYARRNDCLRADRMRWDQSTGQCIRR